MSDRMWLGNGSLDDLLYSPGDNYPDAWPQPSPAQSHAHAQALEDVLHSTEPARDEGDTQPMALDNPPVIVKPSPAQVLRDAGIYPPGYDPLAFVDDAPEPSPADVSLTTICLYCGYARPDWGDTCPNCGKTH